MLVTPLHTVRVHASAAPPDAHTHSLLSGSQKAAVVFRVPSLLHRPGLLLPASHLPLCRGLQEDVPGPQNPPLWLSDGHQPQAVNALEQITGGRDEETQAVLVEQVKPQRLETHSGREVIGSSCNGQGRGQGSDLPEETFPSVLWSALLPRQEDGQNRVPTGYHFPVPRCL